MKAYVKVNRTYLRKKTSYRVNGGLWMESGENLAFGPGLERIDQTESINQAAEQMDMIYKSQYAGQTTSVILHVEGEKGDGVKVTSEAREFIAYHRHLRKRFTAFLESETKNLSNK